MSERYSQQELKEYFYEALSMFNEALDSDITPETVVLDFFTPENGLSVYRDFCANYFPNRYEKRHEAEGYFENVAAEAFMQKQIVIQNMLFATAMENHCHTLNSNESGNISPLERPRNEPMCDM